MNIFSRRRSPFPMREPNPFRKPRSPFSSRGLGFSFPRMRQEEAHIYAQAAVKAVECFSEFGCPEKSWEHAIAQYTDSQSSRDKPCPRSAFLGLCQEGLVKGVPAGAYTISKKNAPHAVAAARLLLEEPELANQDPVDLWSTVTYRLGIPHTSHQGQMDVLLALWGANKIVRV